MEMKLAEAAVSFAVKKLGEALINKVAFLQGVEEQVNLLKDELEMMYGFLQDATQKQATNNGIRAWISQIRQVAHDVEDVIETFSLKIDTPRKSRGMLENCACFPCHVNHLDKLGKEIESIRARLKNIDESCKRLGIEDHGEGSRFRRPQNIALQRRQLVPQQKDKDVVGLEKYVDELLGKAILNDSPGLSIARITGIGGLGKSTLAREVYNHADVVARFKHSRAWVVVSEDFDAEGVIRMLLKQLGGSVGDTEKLSLVELKSKLLDQLRGKQYFIVLDDVWEQQHWDLLEDAFPDEQGHYIIFSPQEPDNKEKQGTNQQQKMEMKLAEAAVSFAVEKLGEALINKVAFLQGVEEQVNLLKDDLEMMYGFLQDAAQKQVTNKRIGVWISQIRRVAHDVEDVIETFSLKIDTPRRRRGMLENCACFPYHLKHLNKLGKEIESIQARLENIDKRRTWFGIQDHGEGSESRRPQNIALQQRRLVPQQKDRDVVGLDRHMESLLNEAILNDDRPGLLIARITGIGGLGKSTLAREVYNHDDVVARFKSHRAWVVVSEEFEPKGVIRKLLEQLGGSGGDTGKSSLEDLKGKLLEQLKGRQYFIVVDDVWQQQQWDLLADAFPDEQGKRSRLLITSHNRNVRNRASFPCELQPLDFDTSWQLFLKSHSLMTPMADALQN